MYTFSHAATGQTDALTDYRYIGNEPNNYVNFNCDNDGNNCETWRIVGIFNVDDGLGNKDYRIKIIRDNLIDDNLAWNSNNVNDWTTSTLMNFLNDNYYNKSGDAGDYGLKDSAKNMVSNTKFYLGGRSFNSTTHYGSTDDMYNWERGTTVYNGRPTEWVGKVALLYPSDVYYTYSKGVDNVCFNDSYKCYGKKYDGPSEGYVDVENPGHPQTGWIYNSILKNDGSGSILWLLSSDVDFSNSSFYFRTFSLENKGVLYAFDDEGLGVTLQGDIQPVLYLSSQVKIADGDGSSGNPYKLSL